MKLYSFLKIRMTCSSMRSFVLLLWTAAISIHSRQGYCLSQCMFLFILIILLFKFLWLMKRFDEDSLVITTLIWRVSFFFSRSPNLGSIILTFSQNSLLSLINSFWVDIRLSCSFILKPKSCSLIIFSNCFLVRVLLHCSKSFNSCRKTSGLYENAAVTSSFISYQTKRHNKKIQ